MEPQEQPQPEQPREAKPWSFTLIEVLVVIGIASLLIGILMQPVSRMPREYHEGKDQKQWAAQLQSEDPQQRQEAVVALCAILKKAEHPWVRRTVIYYLGSAGAEGKPALPLLTELWERDEPELRDEAGRSIYKIDPEAARKLGIDP